MQKNILIIGGSSGIGEALVNQLNANQHHIYEISKRGNHTDGIHSLSLDILERPIPLEFLPNSLDGLVYCPGSIQLKPFRSLKKEDFLHDFHINVMGAIDVLQQTLPLLKKSPNMPSIVLFSTVAVQLGMSFHSSVSASKGAIEGITRALAAEFSPNIRVNCVAPSITNTPLAFKFLNTEEKIKSSEQRHPLKKIGDPNDIAQAVLWLLSDHSKWVTGQIFHIDGGLSTIKI